MTASPFGPGYGPNMILQPALNRFWIPSSIAGPTFATVEFLVLTLSPVLGSLIYHAPAAPEAGPAVPPMLVVGAIMASLYLVLSHTRGLFDVDNLRSVSLRAPLLNWCFALMFFGVIVFAFKIGNEFSRGAMTLSFLIGASAIVGLRLAVPVTLNMAYRHRVIGGRRTMLLSAGPLPPSVPINELIQHGLSVHGWFQLPFAGTASDTAKFEGECEAIRRFARDRRIEDIVIVADTLCDRKVAGALEQLRILPIRVLLLAQQPLGSIIRTQQSRDIASLALTVQTPPFTNAERQAKRLFDVVVGSALLVLASPLLLLIALAIRLDSRGPVLFRQTRIGFCGRPFMIFKFRSMYTVENGQVIKQAERGDSRITRIGSFLRVTSLDELPQLLNVIIGDMSLVGPRPHAMAHDRYYGPLVPNYDWRQHALPGITGWAQVNGYRGETRTPSSMEARVAHDLWYIKNWSIWLDLKILFMTVRAVLKSTNAY